MKTMNTRFVGLLGGVVLAGAGCAEMPVSEQLRDARDTVAMAHESPAARYELDQLRVADRTLARANAAENSSQLEIDLAYVADRQARMAVANATRAQSLEDTRAQQAAYQQELEALAQRRGEALEATERYVAEQRSRIVEQQQALDEQGRALTDEQRARADAEQRASDALERLRALASVNQDNGRTVITLSGEVLFETDRATLRPEARERLLAVVDALRSNPPDQQVVIAGHTDGRGSDGYNCDLSQRRADAVRMFLLGEGVPAERVQAVGFGEARPIASNTDAEGRANNRRVEIIMGRRASEDIVASACPIR